MHPFNLGLQVDVIRPWDVYGLNLEEKTLLQYFKERLRDGHVGKWHLGLSKQAFLLQNRGFDHQYGHYLYDRLLYSRPFGRHRLAPQRHAKRGRLHHGFDGRRSGSIDRTT